MTSWLGTIFLGHPFFPSELCRCCSLEYCWYWILLWRSLRQVWFSPLLCSLLFCLEAWRVLNHSHSLSQSFLPFLPCFPLPAHMYLSFNVILKTQFCTLFNVEITFWELPLQNGLNTTATLLWSSGCGKCFLRRTSMASETNNTPNVQATGLFL